jgi:hypothetical protein
LGLTWFDVGKNPDSTGLSSLSPRFDSLDSSTLFGTHTDFTKRRKHPIPTNNNYVVVSWDMVGSSKEYDFYE